MTTTNKTVGTSTQTNNASDLFRPATNPFLADVPVAAAAPAQEGYALFASGPAVDANEVEVAHVGQVEVRIAWGETQLHVAHLATVRSFYVGEEQSKNISCDYFLPAEKLGATRAPLVFVRGGASYAVLFQGATGFVQQGGKRSSIDELIASGGVEPCPELAGAVMVVLAAGTSVQMAHNGMNFYVASVAAGRRFAAPLLGAGSLASAIMVGLSCLVHTGLLAGFAFFKPELGGVDDDEARKERQYLMAQILKSTQDPEQDQPKNEEPSDGGNSKVGAQAKDANGAMGKKDMAAANLKWGKEGPKDNKEPMLDKTRGERVAEAASFGIIGMLQQANQGGDPSAPTAPWGRELAQGADARSADGAFFGSDIGDSGGSGGLGTSGVGIGGGGMYDGIGLNSIGTIGSNGTCQGANCSNVGSSHGRMQGEHKATAPKMTPGTTTLNGRLPKEVVQRVIRQNFGRFRACYETGLRNNPTLAGRVAVRFVIGRDGAVANVGNGGSDLPDSAVVSCVVRSFGGLSFPAPEDGIVTVVYPLQFTPGQLAVQGVTNRNPKPATHTHGRRPTWTPAVRRSMRKYQGRSPGLRTWRARILSATCTARSHFRLRSEPMSAARADGSEVGNHRLLARPYRTRRRRPPFAVRRAQLRFPAIWTFSIAVVTLAVGPTGPLGGLASSHSRNLVKGRTFRAPGDDRS